MEVAFTQQDVVVTSDLDFGPVVGIEEHPVSDLDRAHVAADRDDARPRQPPADGRGGRDDDASRRAALAALTVERHEHPIMEHSHGQLVRRGRAHRTSLRVGRSGVAARPPDQERQTHHSSDCGAQDLHSRTSICIDELGLEIGETSADELPRFDLVDELVNSGRQPLRGLEEFLLDLVGCALRRPFGHGRTRNRLP
jgi:hypothetical protein